jgi:hypothetical protein
LRAQATVGLGVTDLRFSTVQEFFRRRGELTRQLVNEVPEQFSYGLASSASPRILCLHGGTLPGA